MASSKVAFDKFRMWKKSRTVLRLTVYERGTEDHFTGSIYHVDEEGGTVGLADEATRDMPVFDLREASFEVTARSLEAVRADSGKLVFKELLVS